MSAAGPAVAAAAAVRLDAARAVLAEVMDPELPGVSVLDLGIVRALHEAGDGALEVALTPTYSGCPATEVIEAAVREALEAAGLGPVRPRLQRAPAWTTDWITPRGHEALRALGIVPPAPRAAAEAQPLRFVPPARPACPRCGSGRTERLAAFGSTACKALHRCTACGEPFDVFKAL